MTKYLITGGSGLVGSALSQLLGNDCIAISSIDCDLTDRKLTFDLFEALKPEYVFHLAARVGGLIANMRYGADFFSQNIRINTNVLDACCKQNVTKVVSLASSCIYPCCAIYPLTETDLHLGPPHESNYPYAYAKRMLHIHSSALRQQYNLNAVVASPNNIYGENDNFDLEDSHVIPAIIRKIYEAKLANDNVTLFGDGTPLREFTYSHDIAKCLIRVMDDYNGIDVINIGTSKEISIKTVAKTIAKALEYNGKILWDTTKPNGQKRKPTNTTKFKRLCRINGKMQYESFTSSIQKTCEWFLENYPNVRGVALK